VQYTAASAIPEERNSDMVGRKKKAFLRDGSLA
jgi:hypothetical protein